MYFTARSEAKAQKARDHLKASRPDIDLNNLVWLSLDLADLKTVTSAVEELKKKEDKVDILSNHSFGISHVDIVYYYYQLVGTDNSNSQ